MQQAGIATEQYSPCLVAGDIRHDHIGAGRAERFSLSQDRRDQHCAGMAAQAYIVIVKRVRRRAVDPRGFRGGALFLAEGECCRTIRRSQHVPHDPHAVFAS
jgi:hypothetical protein